MLEPLRQVGGYELLEVIDRGSGAVVYQADDPSLELRVALKELSPPDGDDPDFAQRFVKAFEVAARLSHPSIVTVHDCFESEGAAWIAMDYLPAGSLRTCLTELTLTQVAGMLDNALAGLSHAARHDVAHLNLKPENLLVADDGHVEIADFGLAGALDAAGSDSPEAPTGTTTGDPLYMAPEQLLGEGPSPETDLYSLGIIAWEALAGYNPFEGHETSMAALYRQAGDDPVPPIETVQPEVDPAFSDWLAMLLAKRPSDRFESADAARHELDDTMLALAGSRWRRQAPILAGGEHAAPSPGAGPAPASGPVAPAEPAITDAPAPWPPPDDRQMVIGRPVRHVGDAAPALPRPRRDADESAPREEPAAPRRPRLPVAERRRRVPTLVGVIAALAGVLAAGVIGGVVTANHRTTTQVTTTPAVSLAASVRPILRAVERAQRTGRSQLGSASTAHLQAAAAGRVADAYAGAARQVQGLPPAQATLPAATSLSTALTQVGHRWRQLAVAATEESHSRYVAAAAALRHSEQQLAQAALAATRGD